MSGAYPHFKPSYTHEELVEHAATNMELEGTGDGTVLRMSGDAGASAWSLFRLTGNRSGIRFSDIVFDGSGVTNAVTTDHLLQVGTGLGSMTAISFFRCKFTGMWPVAGMPSTSKLLTQTR